jgi:hypothetical protein
MNEGNPSTLVIGDSRALAPSCRIRLSIGQKLAIFFFAFLGATYVNTHLAVKLFDSLGSSAYIVNETPPALPEPEIAYSPARTATNDAPSSCRSTPTTIAGHIKTYLRGEDDPLENNPQLTDAGGLTSCRYAGAVVTLVNNVSIRRRRQAAPVCMMPRRCWSAQAIVVSLAKTDAG